MHVTVICVMIALTVYLFYLENRSNKLRDVIKAFITNSAYSQSSKYHKFGILPMLITGEDSILLPINSRINLVNMMDYSLDDMRYNY
jgi:hypothetical protein